MESSNNTEKQNEKVVEPIAPELGFEIRIPVLLYRINYASSPLLEYSYPPINETIVKNITNG